MTIGVLALLLVVALGCRLLLGATGLGIPDDPFILSLRGALAVSAFAVGVGLAVAGVLLQSVLRNPIASPFVLGLTSGAFLGLVVALWLQGSGVVSRVPEPVGPMVGGGLALVAVYWLGRGGSRRTGARGLDPLALILAGVVVSVIAGAVASLIQHTLPDRGVAAASRWMFGSLSEETRWPTILTVLGLTLAGAGYSWKLSRELDAAALGDDEAYSVGLDLASLRVRAFVVASVLTAAAVTLAGPVGFVGLVAPHLARLLVGGRHGGVIVVAALLGGLAVVGADLASTAVSIARSDNLRIPVGILTALIGGPCFLVLLKQQTLWRSGEAR